MSDSQRFPVAAHALAYLAHKGAYSPAEAAPSAVLAASIPTNPVVVRRVTALLAKAGLIATRPGASGGAWLLHRPESITLDRVLKAVNGCAHLGSPPAGAKNCPVSTHIPRRRRAEVGAAVHRLQDPVEGDALGAVQQPGPARGAGPGGDQPGLGQQGRHPPHHHRIGRHRGGQNRARRGLGRRVGALVGQIGQGVGGDGESLAV